MAMNDAVKRKEPEPEVEKAEAKTSEATEAKEAPKIAIAVAANPATDEPESKRLKPTPPNPATVRKQVEYYLSDDNMKFDKFFHDKMSGNSEGWLEIASILQCNKMKAMRATAEDVVASLKDSKIEIKEDKLSVRRPGNLALPTLETRPTHQKKSVAHAHDGGCIVVFKEIPAEQTWMVLKDKLREKLPAKVQIWFVSEVSEQKSCTVAIAPFEGDTQFFEELKFEMAGATLKNEVAHGDALQNALKMLPKHIREKREKEARKKQKERNRPITVGSQRFVNINALRTRVKEILNSRSDGEKLNPDGSDYKLIKAVLGFHPKGEEKSKGLVGIKVGSSTQGGNRCFWMVKDDGKEEDFSSVKCLQAIEANPPYVEAPKAAETKEAAPKAEATKAATPTEPEAAKSEEPKAATEEKPKEAGEKPKEAEAEAKKAETAPAAETTAA